LALVPARSSRAGDGLSLAEAVSRALSDGYGVRIAELTTGQAEDAVRETRGKYLPHVYVTSGACFSSRRTEKLVALDGNFQVREYGLSALASDEGWLNVFVDQLLFDARQLKQIEREKIAADVARVSEAQERERIAYDVTTRFADIVRLQLLADEARAHAEQARQLDNRADQLLGAGRAVESERELVALHLAEAEIDAQARRAEASHARAALWSSITGGEQSGGVVRLAGGSLPEPVLHLSGAELEEAMAGSPEVRVLELRRQMEETNVGAASARRLPTLGFRAGYSHYGADRFDLFPDEWRVGIDLRIPIFDGFEAKSAISGAVKGAEIARLRYHSLLDTKRSRLHDLARKLEAADARLELARRRAQGAAERVRLTDLKLEASRSTLEQALAARERRVRDAQEATNAYFTRFDLWTALQYELGRLTVAVLGSRAAATP
jgi:outer membrane protein TolC